MKNQIIKSQDFIFKFNSIYSNADKFQVVDKLLSYPMINFINQFFSRTRNYWLCLNFVDICREIIEHYKSIGYVSSKRYEELDRIQIGYELNSYDHLNLWDLYIQMYEELKNKKYINKYPVTNQYLSENQDFLKNVLYKDDQFFYVHFLYTYKKRYEIICRKQQKLDAGKNVKHLMRHQQEQLSEQELNDRYNEMVSFLKFMKNRHEI